MRALRVAIGAAATAAVLWIASFASAAPGDYRLVTGTLVYPVSISTERTIVIQSDDGVTHFAELAPTELVPRARAGERVSVLGREGFQPTQILFGQLQRLADSDSGAPSALPTALTSPPAANDIRDSNDVIVGTVERVQGRSLSVTTSKGSRVQIDVSSIDVGIRRDLRPGDPVTVYAPQRRGGVPVASGILVEHSVPPSALPR
jgi:hypothetical protein